MSYPAFHRGRMAALGGNAGDPIHAWSFVNQVGTTIVDTAGSLNGESVNITPTGEDGCWFDGTSSYVVFPLPAIPLTTDFTVVFDASVFSDIFSALCSQYNITPSMSANRTIFELSRTPYKYGFFNGVAGELISSASFVPEEFTTFVFTREGTLFSLYKNGVIDVNNMTSTAALQNVRFIIGGYFYKNTTGTPTDARAIFSGYVRSARIYDRALSASEIAGL